ncbi:FAD/NAD(P)-binding protein [Brachybacterium sp. J144]|uniref:FAD/NAD(P)-binding protein n=1 Tax=Brachybacterium sp. J144 TaxID=3116487 RepID=UPI002E77F155|nr:FAD/NAD(P)-binding protein [Brachybacterium sp. J144]MEE1650131.1 FAD/NAD(P)-binding protein [Brachybacterium sp. J144]
MTPQRTAHAPRLVIVGGGPRALGVLERLAARLAHEDPQATGPLRVDILDPHLPGSGRIWRAAESPLLLMNSRAADVSIFTDETVEMDGPVVAGPSLAEWAEGIRRGDIAPPTAGTARLAEIRALRPTDFASRRVQALYLEWFAGQVLAALPQTVEVAVHRTTATGLAPRTDRGWLVELEDRDRLEADLVLLAAGHTDARPSADRHELAAFARRHGAVYLGPSQASDAPLAQLGAGQDVIVRGMGLAFVDLLALLTEGRGGRFEPAATGADPDRLHYLPSGKEPRLWVGSRRGVPYHSKVRDEGAPTGLAPFVHLTAEALRAREAADGLLDFRTDVLPLIAAEIAEQVPGAPAPSAGEAPLAWLDEPLAWLVGDAPEQVTRDAVVRHIEQDLRARTRGDVTSARTLFQLLLRMHGTLVDLLPAERLRGGAAGDYPRWWHSLFSFVDSGPPPHRLHQLLALERAGVVRFLGPGLRVTADESLGRFTARGAGGTQVTADTLLDAFLPAPTLVESTNPLLRDLVAAGGGAVGRESTTSPGTLDVDADHRVLAPDGTPREGLWAVGPWTSELPIGAFARPRTNAPCHRRNDALAGEMLAAARRRAIAPTAATSASVSPAVALPGSVPVADRLALHVEDAHRAPARPLRPLRLGVLGPGKIGRALARTAMRAGLEVAVHGRAGAPALAAQLPGARPVGLRDLAATSDMVMLTVPLHVALTLDPAALAGTVLVDVTNPWGEADAAAVAAARTALGDHAGELSTSELIAARLPGATVVKTLNHIGYHDVEEQGRASGDPVRRAIALAADDHGAAELVGSLLHRLGYDPVPLGPLAAGRDLEPGAALFSGWSTREELDLLRAAQVRAA